MNELTKNQSVESVLHNRGINSGVKNFDLLSEFLIDEFIHQVCTHTKFSLVGFDFGEDGFLRQIQPMVDYDIFEVLREVYHDDSFGDRFCILHHDLMGFHYICY